MVEKIQTKTAEEIWEMMDNLKRANEVVRNPVPYGEFETPKMKFVDVGVLKQWIDHEIKDYKDSMEYYDKDDSTWINYEGRVTILQELLACLEDTQK